MEVRRLAALIVATKLLEQTRRPGVRVSTEVAGFRSPVGVCVRWRCFQWLLSCCCLPVVVVGCLLLEFFLRSCVLCRRRAAGEGDGLRALPRLGGRCLPVADGWVGLVEGLVARTTSRLSAARDGCCVWSSSAIIAPVDDGSDEPHHGNEDECDPHRVDFVKQHGIATFSLAPCLRVTWRLALGGRRLPVSAPRADKRSESCPTCRRDRRSGTCNHCHRQATRSAPYSR
jgi:hypothetical protein